MIQDRDAIVIGNEWLKPASSKTFQRIGASTGEMIAAVPKAIGADVDRAVAVARTPFNHSGLAAMAAAERAIVIRESKAKISAILHCEGRPDR